MAGKRGRPKKDEMANKQKSTLQALEEKLAVQEKQNKEGQETADILRAQIEIEKLDSNLKAVFLEKQNHVMNYIKKLCTIEALDDVAEKLGIEGMPETRITEAEAREPEQADSESMEPMEPAE